MFPKTYTFVVREGYDGAGDRLYDKFVSAGLSPTKSDYAVKVTVNNSSENSILRSTLTGCHSDCPYGRKVKGAVCSPVDAGDGPFGVHCHRTILYTPKID